MSKRKKTPSYFTLLIPGIFMAVLGIGNVVLGSFKYEQYQEVLIATKLSLPSTTSSSINTSTNLSPLQRLKSTENRSSRNLALLRKAETRRDLYSLVIYGGKVFIILSILLLAGAVIKKFLEENKVLSQGLKTKV